MGFINSTHQFKFPTFDGSEFLNEGEVNKVTALFEAIFPGDHSNGVPGATDAGAARFLSRLLAISEDEYYKILEWRTNYRNGLELLDEVANEMFQNGVSDLTQEQAHKFLEKMEKGTLTGLPSNFDQKSFFRMLQEHCLKGCFSDPRWGGNTNGIMWKWLGWIQPAEDIQF